ncbi:hypothetical protein [Roseobacter cerasinus]|uniref:hypothetical protein n=1 Tax=Roseobacter cerasinus TaxID=2602289 RepID=UPI00135917B6|nr:hypothetical protein [Roseobacter cerasinus]
MRLALAAVCLLSVTACVDPSASSRTPSKADAPAKKTGITVSGHALFGYVTGG